MHIAALLGPTQPSRRSRNPHPREPKSASSFAPPSRHSTDTFIADRVPASHSSSDDPALLVSDVTSSSSCYAEYAHRSSGCRERRPSSATATTARRSSIEYSSIRRSSLEYSSRRSSLETTSRRSRSLYSASRRSARFYDTTTTTTAAGTPRRFSSFAFVWTGPSMSGFLIRVTDAAAAALNTASNDLTPASPALRASLERDIIDATVRAPRECLAALIWIWKVNNRNDFVACLQRHVRHLSTWRAAVGDRTIVHHALANGAVFNMLELAENSDGGWWRHAEFFGLRAICSREFDFRPERAHESIGRAATSLEHGDAVSCAAMATLLELQDILGGPAVRPHAVVQYVLDLYCAYALRTAAFVLNTQLCDAPWRAPSARTCTPLQRAEQHVLDAMGVAHDIPRGFRERLRPELRSSIVAARHRVDGTRAPRPLSDTERSTELLELVRAKRKHCRLVTYAEDAASDPLLLIMRHVDWRRLDTAGALDVGAAKRELGSFVMMALNKNELEQPRNSALGIDVARADKRAARLWCSSDSVRVPKFGATRAIRTPDDMRRYLHVESLETYVALTNAHAAWADASDVGYARRAWNGPIPVNEGLNALRAAQFLIFVPIGPHSLFSVLDWDLKLARRIDHTHIVIEREHTHSPLDNDRLHLVDPLSLSRKDIYV